MAGLTLALSDDERAKTLWQVVKLLQQPEVLVTLRREPLYDEAINEGSGRVPSRLSIVIEENPQVPCRAVGPRGIRCELDRGHDDHGVHHHGRKTDDEGIWTVEW